MRKTTIINKLGEARKLIQRGWVQDTYVDRGLTTDCFCAVGAVRETVKAQASRQQLINALHAALPKVDQANEEYGDVFYENAVVSYNDAFGRTKQDVLRLFTRAINKLKGTTK